MKPKVVITIDTEPDNQWDITLRRNPQFKNISELPKLQRLFDKFSVRPTYLATFSVAKSDVAFVLKDIAKSVDCEIGSHLHTWETPPFKSPIKGNGSYLHQYSFDVQDEKMGNLDNIISEIFGYKSVSYKGGRYSFDRNTIELLFKYGYFVDTSVTPGISWENDGGTNFKKLTHRDYFIHRDGRPDILEVPVSIKVKSNAQKISNFLYLNLPMWTHAEGILRRLVGFDIIWLDPSFNTYEDMKWISDVLLEEDVFCLNIMFHSSVIIKGGTPYTMTEDNTRKFFDRLERLLEYLLKVKNLETLTLKEYYNHRRNILGREEL